MDDAAARALWDAVGLSGLRNDRRIGAPAIANTASGTHVEIAMEWAYRTDGELEARDRMVDAPVRCRA